MSGPTHIHMGEEVSSKNVSVNHPSWPFKKFDKLTSEIKNEFLSYCAELLADLELRKIPISHRALHIASYLFGVGLFDWAYDILIHSTLGENPLEFLAFVINYWLGESITPQQLNEILSSVSFTAIDLAAVGSLPASQSAAPSTICINNQYASSCTDRQPLSTASSKKVSSVKNRRSRKKKSLSSGSLPLATTSEMFNFSESVNPLPGATGSVCPSINLKRSIYDPMNVKVSRQCQLIKKSVSLLNECIHVVAPVQPVDYVQYVCGANVKNAFIPPFLKFDMELLANELETDPKSFCDVYLAESETVLNACIESAYKLINTGECVYDFVIPLILQWKMILNEKSMSVADVSSFVVPEGQQFSSLTSEPTSLSFPLSQSKAIADSQTLCSDPPALARLADLAEGSELPLCTAPVPGPLQEDNSVIPPCTKDDIVCNHEFPLSESEIKFLQSDINERSISVEENSCFPVSEGQLFSPLTSEPINLKLPQSQSETIADLQILRSDPPAPARLADVAEDLEPLLDMAPLPGPLQVDISDIQHCNMHNSGSVEKIQPCNMHNSESVETLQPCNMHSSESVETLQSCNMQNSESVKKLQPCSLNVSTIPPCNKHDLDPLLNIAEIADIQSCLTCSPEILPYVRKSSVSLSRVAEIPQYPTYPSCSTEVLPTSVGIAVILTCFSALLELHSNVVSNEPLVTSEEVAEALVIHEKLYDCESAVVEISAHDGFMPGSGVGLAAPVAEVHSSSACPEAAPVPVCSNGFRDTECPKVPCAVACPEAFLVVSRPGGVLGHTCPDTVLIVKNSDYDSLPSESGLGISLGSTGGPVGSLCDLQGGSSRSGSRWSFEVLWEISAEFCHDCLDWFGIECFVKDCSVGQGVEKFNSLEHCLGGRGYCSGSCGGHSSGGHGPDGCHSGACGADGHGFWGSGDDSFCLRWINSGVLLFWAVLTIMNLQSKHFAKYGVLERRLESAFKGGGSVTIASVALAVGCDFIAAKPCFNASVCCLHNICSNEMHLLLSLCSIHSAGWISQLPVICVEI